MPDLNQLTDIVANYGYFAIFFLMFLEGMCIPIPSELIMGFAGFLIFQDKLSLPGAIATGWLGSFCGSLTIFLIARKGGRKFLYRWGHLIHLGPRRLDMISDWFTRYGPFLIIPWRQLPVIRTKASIAAGLLDMRLMTFSLFTGIGIAVCCIITTSLGFYFGQSWPTLLAIFEDIGHYVIISILAAIIALGIYLKRRKIKEEVQ